MSFLISFVISLYCGTPTAWVERTPAGYVPMCGDEDGNPVGSAGKRWKGF
jgi:hypothetical protein